MKITRDHALFYASKKSKLFKQTTNIHELINSQLQVENRGSLADKHNDLNYIKLVYNRCKRNNISFKYEILRLLQGTHSGSRKRLLVKVYSKLK
jgi:hypothetical protein